MSMRELVTGGAACAVPGTSSSNPLGALANTLLGSSSKQERLKELPTASITQSDVSDFRADNHLQSLPGSEYDLQQYSKPSDPSSQFLSGFRGIGDHGDLSEAWNEIHRPPVVPSSDVMERIDQRYDGTSSQFQPTWNGPQQVLSGLLHSFVDSSRTGVPFLPAQLPSLGLSQGDKQCIRDRSSIIARHIFADKSDDYINAQVNTLLLSLEIDNDLRMKGPVHGRFQELEKYWNESQGSLASRPPDSSEEWVTEFGQHHVYMEPEPWADSYEKLHGVNGWASEFEQEQSQMAVQMGGANISSIGHVEQTRMLAQTLAQNNDPKFQNSKFLQFVSKMSRGELIVEDNQIKEAEGSLSGNWTEEYHQQYSKDPGFMANQFAQEKSNTWEDEFSREHHRHVTEDSWVDEFSKMHIKDQDWVEEFGHQIGKGAFESSSADNWADAYDQYLDEQFMTLKQKSDSGGVYVFSDMNPYVGHPNPLREGQELFRKGLLSEAVLALEAEVLKNPDNAEGWRLLGITHAENDDDQQAIASMMRAHEVDPRNLEVLLALGVSHTNELEQAQALKFLYKWLQHHPKYGALASQEKADSPYYADVARLFNEASQMSPEDADVHIVLGVLYNLSREYDKAIESFERALKLKPRDYSLWNKLGATQANSVHSADAILAYQQALDLKPNYVRAWANMGISYANQGMYEESIQYYVRALAMNPKADNAWQYLRISLSLASRNDMFEACDSRNLDLLQKEFPL